jgi:hypothetical protein
MITTTKPSPHHVTTGWIGQGPGRPATEYPGWLFNQKLDAILATVPHGAEVKSVGVSWPGNGNALVVIHWTEAA